MMLRKISFCAGSVRCAFEKRFWTTSGARKHLTLPQIAWVEALPNRAMLAGDGGLTSDPYNPLMMTVVEVNTLRTLIPKGNQRIFAA